MKPNHEHEFEAAPGLPEPLPASEKILWQGSPDWRVLGNEAFHLKTLSIYFALMVALQALLSWDAALGLSKNLMALLTSSLLACVALGLLALTAWLSASTTLYTITDKRIVMRIGIVLTLTFNLPFSRIQAAQIKNSKNGKGNIAVDLQGPDRIAYLHLWPHARPWHLKQPQPMLRALPEVANVGSLLQASWEKGRHTIDNSSLSSHSSSNSLRVERKSIAISSTAMAQ
jgi:hypothetical protein